MGVTTESTSKSFPISEKQQNQLGFSKNASMLRIVYESCKVRIIIWKRYRAEMVGSIIQLLILTSFFYLFATAVGFRGYAQFGTREIFIFFLTGFLIMIFDGVTIWTPLNTTTRDLYNGTLEYLYLSPHKKYPYYGGYLLGSVIVNVLIGFIPMFFILVWYADLSFTSSTMIILVTSLLMLSFLGFGIIIGLSAILWKQVQSLASLLGLVTQFMTGAIIPLASMPEIFRYIGYLFPHTWGYELIRYYSFGGRWHTILPLEWNWVLLVFFFILYTLLALFLHKKVVNHAKTKGLHLI